MGTERSLGGLQLGARLDGDDERDFCQPPAGTLFRDTVIAYRFGQNALTDAYRAAFQLPDLLFFMVAGGALSSALMPVFCALLGKQSKRRGVARLLHRGDHYGEPHPRAGGAAGGSHCASHPPDVPWL
jgi:hypothetical protein